MPLLVRSNLPSNRRTMLTVSPFKGKIELKKYSREEYDSMSTAQCQHLYELQKKARLIEGKKAAESSSGLQA